jgi:NADP-dependent 3-hydroxy acid dehydrogenase YdfG
MRIQGSTVLLTGATGGIGQTVARSLRARGAELILTGRRAEVLSSLADELGAKVVPADLADRADVEMLVRSVGPIDILIANAALPGSGLLLGFDQEEIDRALEVNLRSPIALCRALVPAMVDRGPASSAKPGCSSTPG